jgi:integrase
MVFAQAKSDGIAGTNPTEGVSVLKKTGERARKPFTLNELKAVLDVARGSEWETVIKLGLFTGQRIGDIVNLKWSAVDFESGEIRFSTRKTGRLVLVPIFPQLSDLLLALDVGDDPDAPVLPESYATFKRKKGAATLSRQFGELLAKAGLRAKILHRKGSGVRRKHPLTFHALRHTAVSMMKNAGVPVSVVMDIVGHESAEISQLYTHTDHASKSEALKHLPEL